MCSGTLMLLLVTRAGPRVRAECALLPLRGPSLAWLLPCCAPAPAPALVVGHSALPQHMVLAFTMVRVLNAYITPPPPPPAQHTHTDTQPSQVHHCSCSTCVHAKEPRALSLPAFERHGGMGRHKRWKTSVRVDDGSDMPLGTWLEVHAGSASEAEGEAEREAQGRTEPLMAAAAAAEVPLMGYRAAGGHSGAHSGDGDEAHQGGSDPMRPGLRQALRIPSGCQTPPQAPCAVAAGQRPRCLLIPDSEAQTLRRGAPVPQPSWPGTHAQDVQAPAQARTQGMDSVLGGSSGGSQPAPTGMAAAVKGLELLDDGEEDKGGVCAPHGQLEWRAQPHADGHAAAAGAAAEGGAEGAAAEGAPAPAPRTLAVRCKDVAGVLDLSSMKVCACSSGLWPMHSCMHVCMDAAAMDAPAWPIVRVPYWGFHIHPATVHVWAPR